MTDVQIVAADKGFSRIAADVQKDPELKAAVGVLGSVIHKMPCFNYNFIFTSFSLEPTTQALTVMLMQWPVGSLCGPQRITAHTMMMWEQAAGPE